MLYANTEKGKLERLENARSQIDNFITKLDSMKNLAGTTSFEILDECNGLCMLVNGAYGRMQAMFDNENNRLGTAYQKFWNRIDNA
jgi:hypothetical protein